MAHTEFRSYLREKVNQMPATLYSPAYLTHPLLQSRNMYIALNWGDTDGTFMERLKHYLDFLPVRTVRT